MRQTNISGKPFSNMELSAFCGQMALILKSGISASEGLQIMLEDASSDEERAVLQVILEDITENGNLSHALEGTHLFPSYLLHMVNIGEETGTLDEVMKALEIHYDREAQIAQSIRSAITYPAIMTAMMIVVVIVILVKVLPVFNQVFVQLGTEMTGFSRILMNMGITVSRYSVFFIVLLLLIGAFVFYGTRTSSGRTLFQKLGHHIPPIRSIGEKIAVCRFASAMALTLSSGLSPERSLELVSALNDDPFFQQKLKNCQELIATGEDLSSALFSSGVLSGMHARMASIGSRTGSMDQVMSQIASLNQEEIDTRMNNALSVIEPALVVILSLIVGVILLSVMLPLMGIMSGI